MAGSLCSIYYVHDLSQWHRPWPARVPCYLVRSVLYSAAFAAKTFGGTGEGAGVVGGVS